MVMTFYSQLVLYALRNLDSIFTLDTSNLIKISTSSSLPTILSDDLSKSNEELRPVEISSRYIDDMCEPIEVWLMQDQKDRWQFEKLTIGLLWSRRLHKKVTCQNVELCILAHYSSKSER